MQSALVAGDTAAAPAGACTVSSPTPAAVQQIIAEETTQDLVDTPVCAGDIASTPGGNKSIGDTDERILDLGQFDLGQWPTWADGRLRPIRLRRADTCRPPEASTRQTKGENKHI